MLGTVPPRYGWDGVRLDSTPTSPWLEEMPLYPLWKWSNGFIPTSKWWLCFKCSVDSNFSGIVSYILNYCYCVEPAISLPLNWDLMWSSLMLLTRQLMNTRRQRRYVSVVIFLVHFFLSVYPFIHSIKRVFSCKGGKFPNCWIPMYLNCQEIRNTGQLYTFTPRTAIKFHVFYDRTPSK